MTSGLASMTSGLAGIHELVGGLVVVAFIILVILAAIQAAGGGENRFVRTMSFVAAGLLVLQYILGVALLSGGARNTTTHYVVALLVLVPVALQHSSMKRLSAQSRGTALVIWSLAAAFLAIIAYLSGQSRF